MSNPFRVSNQAKEGQPTRYYSNLQEKAVAKAVGGHKTKNSGATLFGGKSDVSISDLFNIECKTKTKSSDTIVMHKEWLLKNERESITDGHPYAALAFNFGPNERNYYVINEELFIELVEYLKNEN